MWIVLIIIALIVIWFVASYNGFVTLRNRAQEAWSDIEVQLKRRYDLIPNLVNTVKGYAAHESTVFENVTEARSQAMQANTPAAQAQAEGQLAGVLKSLFAVAEAYPNLKANENFLALQTELADTENKIQAARRFYNTNVRDLNIRIEHFPGNIIANMFHIQEMQFFDIPENGVESQPVQVKF